MDIDVDRYLGAVARSVGTVERDGRTARVVTLTRLYDTSVTDLWDACTNAERIPRWFLPVSGDLRLGGRYQLQGNAGGEISECTPPTHLALTWEFGGKTSWVEVRLAQEDEDRARLTLEHIAHVDEFWDEYGPGAVGVGWDLALTGLGEHLETGAAVDHAEAEAWSTSAAGKTFIRGSSDDWRRASIEAGTDAKAATAAAQRTTAFYTGEALPHD